MSEISTLIEGKYDVIAKISEGGMGTIYKVRHRLLEEIRVVKVMRQSVMGDAELKRRFVEEAKTATRLKHPNIATIYDFALGDDGTAYLVMEFIDGVTLREILLSQGSVGLALSLEITHQTLLALGYLHRKNVIHRDIAPDNLMLTYDEEGDSRIKLIDLGIAKVLDRRGEMTSTGVFLGKVRYASPEQYGSLLPGETIDGRSDLYSLGLVLYELLTGHRPFAGETPIELLRAHVFQEPTSFSITDPEGLVPERVRAVVFKALQKRREDRFISAQDLDREILSLKGEFTRPFDIDPAQAIISLVRGSPVDGTDFVTPSAQDRLDRHFLAHPTPVPPTIPRGTVIPDTVVDSEAKEVLLLKEIRERESKGDLHGLESVAQACSETSRAGQAAREAVRRLQERASFEKEKREAEEADWRECEAQASETAWQGYVNRHPDSPRRDEASRKLAEAGDFRKALEAGTSRGWKAFVEQWPRSSRRGEADKRLQESSKKEEAAFAATVISVQEKQARLLEEIQERERRRDLSGLKEIAEATPAGARVEQAARSAILRIQESAAREEREAEEEDWRRCTSENSEEVWKSYLGRHPDSPRREEAVQRVAESRAFREAAEAATSLAWKVFLDKWPRSSHRKEAEKRARESKEKEDASLAEASRIGTPEAYRVFLKEHPDSYLAPTAGRYLEEQVAFDSAQRSNTVRAWREFGSRWPSGRLSARAAAGLKAEQKRETDAHNTALEEGTSRALQQFLARFPETAARSRVEADLRESLAFEAAGAEGKAGWERFLGTYAEGRLSAAARMALLKLDEKEAADKERREEERLLLEVRRFEEAGREADLESLAKEHSDHVTIADAARAAIGRLHETEQRKRAAEKVQEALRLKLETEQKRREDEERKREAEKQRESEAKREREAARLSQREAAERDREAAKQRDLEAKRQREEAKQREREAEERKLKEARQRELEVQREHEALSRRQREEEEREREAAKQREMEAAREQEAAKQRQREVEKREREAAKQQALEAKREREGAKQRQREEEERERAARAVPGVVAGRNRRYVGLAAAAVLIAAAGVWVVSHRTGDSKLEKEVPTTAVPIEPTAAPIPATAVAPEERPREPRVLASGSLIIDALPWAEVVRVDDSSGKNWLDGKQSYTPMMIPLPPGKYSVVFKNGNFQDRTVSVSAEVREGTSTSCTGQFQQVDPAAYFEMEGWRK